MTIGFLPEEDVGRRRDAASHLALFFHLARPKDAMLLSSAKSPYIRPREYS